MKKWTKEEIKELKRLYSMGYFEREIAEIMDITINQVHGGTLRYCLNRFNPLLNPVERCTALKG